LSGGNLPQLPVEPPTQKDQTDGWRRCRWKMGRISMLTVRVTYGLGGLLLVNVVLLAAQMVLGVNFLPI
jgi:hypothetical protein